MRTNTLPKRLRAATLTGVVLTAGLVLAAPAEASGAGAWTETGPMVTARNSHTEALLPGGKVLVAGGWTLEARIGDRETLDSAEIFDPNSGANGTWSETASMNNPRRNHGAAPLSGGSVLVAGGYGGTNYPAPVLDSAEIFDPNTGSWTATGSMVRAAFDVDLVPMSNGKVMAISANGGILSAQIFDPATDSWSDGGLIDLPLDGGRALTLLNDNTILVSGGFDRVFWTEVPRDDVFLYDLATGQLTGTTSLHDARFNHSATLLNDGTVLVAGGTGSSRGEVFDPGTAIWTPVGDMPTPREHHAVATLGNGTVLLAGGWAVGAGRTQTNTADVYHPDSGTWTAAADMAFRRFNHTLTALPDGTALAAGHTGLIGEENAVPEFYTP